MKTTSKTTKNEKAVTQPNIPDYAQGPIQNFYSGVGDFANGNPADFTTPANYLQQGVFNAFGAPLPSSVSGPTQSLALNGGTTTVLPTSSQGQSGTAFDGTDLAMRKAASQTQSLLSNMTRPPTATTTTAQAPDRYDPAAVERVQPAGVMQAGVADRGPAALAGDTSGLADKTVNTYGGARALPFINDYLDPQLSSLVDAALANYDDTAGRAQAAYAAEGAANKAFGGSRYGIGEAQLGSDLTRGRAMTEAELRNTAWQNALGAAQGDASNINQAGIASMQAQNSRDELLGNLSTQLGMFNAGQQNDVSQSMFDAINQASQFNAGEVNAMLSQQFGAETAAALQDAAARNAAQSQFYSTEAGLNQFNAGEANDTSQFNVNADLQNTGQQLQGTRQLADLANMRAGNTRDNLGMQMDVGNQLWQLQNQNSPLGQLLTTQGLLDPALLQAITGQTITSTGTGTSKESGGLLGDIIAAGAGLGASAITKSERRVKRDIVKLGEASDGLGVYRYNYVWDTPETLPRFGVMVDEVEAIRPWALGPVVDGVQTVDYGAL